MPFLHQTVGVLHGNGGIIDENADRKRHAPSVMMLMVSPRSARAASDLRIESGIEMRITRVDRHEPRNRKIIKPVRPAALPASRTTSAMVPETTQNLTVPSGQVEIGDWQYPIRLNSAPEAISALNVLLIKVVAGSLVLVRDAAYVRDGSPPQQNIVRADGRRSILLTILKNGEAWTLSAVNNVKGFLSQIRAAALDGAKIDLLFDQSVFQIAFVTR